MGNRPTALQVSVALRKSWLAKLIILPHPSAA
jgi:hypothetical protein